MFGARTDTIESEKQQILWLDEIDYASDVVEKLSIKQLQHRRFLANVDNHIFAL